MASLYGPNLKVKRAKEHLDLLKRKVDALRKSKCYRITREKDFKAGEYRVKVTMVNPPIDPLSLIAGDFIGSLRASLDHLAFRLAIKNDILPTDNVSFPIWDGPHPNSKSRRFIENATRGMPQGAIGIIESFQPYNHRDAYKRSYLWQLNHLWNVDKHRHLTFHSGYVHANFPELAQNTKPIRHEELNGGGVLVFPLNAVRKSVKLKPKPRVEIRFGDEREDLLLTIEDFFDIYEFVCNKLIPKFAGFLK